MAVTEEPAEETTEHGFGTGLRAQLEARASEADKAARKSAALAARGGRRGGAAAAGAGACGREPRHRCRRRAA